MSVGVTCSSKKTFSTWKTKNFFDCIMYFSTVNLPPTLARSQVSSVRKHLKLQLLNLLKQPSAAEFHTQITTLLTDLGATDQEVMRSLPKPEELRKRPRSTEEPTQQTKRLKQEVKFHSSSLNTMKPILLNLTLPYNVATT